jgi:hypothetical protein
MIMISPILKRASVFAIALCVFGCSPPTQVERENRRLVDATLTAITLKDVALLEESSKDADARYEAGHITEWEYDQISDVIEVARAGDWKKSEKLGYEFRKQRPFISDGR